MIEQIQHTHDAEQLQQTWRSLHPADRDAPDIALAAARKLVELQGDAQQARSWLLPVLEQFIQAPQSLTSTQALRLFTVLPQALDGLDATWLARLETAHRAAPQEPRLQYLAGMACMEQQLWGKGEQLLQGAVQRLDDAALRARAWTALAVVAEQREDSQAAAQAWRQAALQNQQ